MSLNFKIVKQEDMNQKHVRKTHQVIYDEANRVVNTRNVYQDIFGSHYPIHIKALNCAHGGSNIFYYAI